MLALLICIYNCKINMIIFCRGGGSSSIDNKLCLNRSGSNPGTNLVFEGFIARHLAFSNKDVSQNGIIYSSFFFPDSYPRFK